MAGKKKGKKGKGKKRAPGGSGASTASAKPGAAPAGSNPSREDGNGQEGAGAAEVAVSSSAEQGQETPYVKRNLVGYLMVSARGLVMGGADVIPGVSGGTMALILGIYRELVASIRSFDMTALKMLMGRRFRDAALHVNLPFLVALGAGIGIAIVSLARVIPHLLKTHPAPVQGLFFGLILGSVYWVWRQIEDSDFRHMLGLILGAVGAWVLVSLIPVTTPEHLPFIFLSGAIAIIAMILPGISGSFILLLLGKYVFILGSLSNLLRGKAFGHSLVVVGVFAAGCGVGLLAFSRLLHWLLRRYEGLTLAVLAGLMIGSLRRIWPYQTYVTKVIRGKTKVVDYTNFWPETWNGELLLAAGLVLVGILVSFGLGWIGKQTKDAAGS